MPNSITEKREQDEDRIFAPRGQAIRDLFLGHDAFHEAFLPHLTESAGEDPGCEPRIVPKDLSEPSQLQERHVAQDEQRPLAPQPLDALPDGVSLVRQERIDPPLVFLRLSPRSSHYPFGPCQTYILSNGYQFARLREARAWHGRGLQRKRIGTDRWHSRSSRARNPPRRGASWRKS